MNWQEARLASMEALSDGVFSVALTLLLLEIRRAGGSLCDRDLRLGERQDFAKLEGGNSGIVQLGRQGDAVVGHRNQQASRGLRVIEKSPDFFGYVVVVADHALGEGAVVVEASGDVAGANAFESAGQQPNPASVD